jgi:hypothetical protein
MPFDKLDPTLVATDLVAFAANHQSIVWMKCAALAFWNKMLKCS